MADINGNGNGNGARNSVSLLSLTQLASTGALLLTLFAFWWNSADPKSRIDKIETSVVETRKELTDSISAFRHEINQDYLKVREHREFETQVRNEMDQLRRFEEHLLTRDEFNLSSNAQSKELDAIAQRVNALYGLIESSRTGHAAKLP